MPYPLKLDESFKRRYQAAVAWPWISFAISAAGFFAPVPAAYAPVAFWVGIISLAIGLIAIVRAGWTVLLNYDCPACGLHLRKPLLDYWAEPQITFDCPDCRVRWDSGLHW
jgi:hypothetical protein